MEPRQYARMYEMERTGWWFRIKRELAFRFVPSTASDGRPARVADLGCGTGIVLAELPAPAVGVGFDLSPEALALSARRGLSRLACATCDAIPAADASFDAVLLLDVIEHLPDDETALREACRVLRPDGLCIVTVPAHPFLWGPHDEVHHHYRRYRKRGLADMLVRSGFEIVKLTPAFATALPAALVVRPLERALSRIAPRRPPTDDFARLPAWLNGLLYRMCRWETRRVARGGLPVGLSLLAVCRPRARASGARA
ncbi:MAG: class I SAM-dependent methyltransferase [Gemmatimonadota bacterium]